MAFISEGGKQYVVSIKETGDRFWYLNNKLHREKGAAIELANGSKSWWYEGVKAPCTNQKDFEAYIGLKKAAAARRYFDVQVECSVPATLTFRVYSDSPENAAANIKNASPTNVKYKLAGRKDRKISVYDAGTSFLRFVKNILG